MVIVTSVEFILESLTLIKKRFAHISSSDDFLQDDNGLEKLDSISMRIQSVGEALKNLDKRNREFLLQAADARYWSEIIKARDFISHHYIDLDAETVSKGINWIFDRATKKGYSFILDSNFAEVSIAQSNIQRLIDKEYIIEINYIFRSLEKSYEFAKKRESVTKRKVPMEIVQRSFKDSFDTTLIIKSMFKETIILNLIDRENATIYEDISEYEFFNLLKGEII